MFQDENCGSSKSDFGHLHAEDAHHTWQQMQPVMNYTAVCSCLLVVRWAARHVLVANPGTSSVGRPKTRLHTFEAVPRSWNAAAAI